MSTTELEAFLEATLEPQISAERAIHQGDVVPRLSTWSHHDPVTLFGAGSAYRSGWQDVRSVFEWLATTFMACEHYDFELLAADVSGDLAYTVGIERYQATTSTGSVVQNTLRVTHVYRREPDGWKIVHRHGDHVPEEPPGVPGVHEEKQSGSST
jgi:ketosteroid isomerase-like protein